MSIVSIVITALAGASTLLFSLLRSSRRKEKQAKAKCQQYRLEAMALHKLIEENAHVRKRQQTLEKEIDNAPSKDLRNRANALFPAE